MARPLAHLLAFLAYHIARSRNRVGTLDKALSRTLREKADWPSGSLRLETQFRSLLPLYRAGNRQTARLTSRAPVLLGQSPAVNGAESLVVNVVQVVAGR